MLIKIASSGSDADQTAASGSDVENGSSSSPSSSASAKDRSLVILPISGSVVAFATSDGLEAYGSNEEGGLWTSSLCKNLKKDN